MHPTIATPTKLTRQMAGVSVPPTWANNPIRAGSRKVR